MLGAEMPEDLRAPAAAGRRLLLDAGLAEMLDGAVADFDRLSGRGSAPLLADPPEGAREVLVTLGAATAPAAAAVARARGAGRPRIGIVGLTWRTPFPDTALRPVLARAERVIVFAHGSSRASGGPWLASAVRPSCRSRRRRRSWPPIPALTTPTSTPSWRRPPRGPTRSGSAREIRPRCPPSRSVRR